MSQAGGGAERKSLTGAIWLHGLAAKWLCALRVSSHDRDSLIRNRAHCAPADAPQKRVVTR
jgi:hypothetical protein